MNNTDHVSQNIENEINSNEVVLFMKGTPVFPQCGFSARVVDILTKVGVKFGSVNVLESDEMRGYIESLKNRIGVLLCEFWFDLYVWGMNTLFFSIEQHVKNS